MNMIKSQNNFKRLLSFLPFAMIKCLIRRAVINQTTSGLIHKTILECRERNFSMGK